MVDSSNLETFKTNFIESLEGIIQKLSDAQRQLVTDAEIDPERLSKLGVVSSVVLSSNNNNLGFPLVLFEHIYRDVELDEESSFSVDILDYAKERVTSDIDVTPVINEDNWMADCISKDLRLNVLRSLLRYPKSESHKYNDVDSTLSYIRSMSGSIVRPILFVGHKELKSPLQRSLYEREITDRYEISRQDGFDKEYICHIGNCEVYALNFSDIDYSLLTSKELFDSVSFRRIADDQYVDVSFELDEGSETVGTLALKYWMKVDLIENTPCIKLELATEDNSSQ